MRIFCLAFSGNICYNSGGKPCRRVIGLSGNSIKPKPAHLEGKIKRIVGNIGALKLPDGKWLFGRIMSDASVEFYKYAGNDKNDLPEEFETAFIVGVHKSVISEMQLVGNRPFTSEEESWPPPKFIYDVIGKRYSRYVFGKITPSTYEECKGLEQASVWEKPHIIDRFMGTGIWPSSVLEEDLSEMD